MTKINTFFFKYPSETFDRLFMTCSLITSIDVLTVSETSNFSSQVTLGDILALLGAIILFVIGSWFGQREKWQKSKTVRAIINEQIPRILKLLDTQKHFYVDCLTGFMDVDYQGNIPVKLFTPTSVDVVLSIGYDRFFDAYLSKPMASKDRELVYGFWSTLLNIKKNTTSFEEGNFKAIELRNSINDQWNSRTMLVANDLEETYHRLSTIAGTDADMVALRNYMTHLWLENQNSDNNFPTSIKNRLIDPMVAAFRQPRYSKFVSHTVLQNGFNAQGSYKDFKNVMETYKTQFSGFEAIHLIQTDIIKQFQDLSVKS